MTKSSEKGFSIIEMMLVVTIIGIIAAIGVPSFQKGIRAVDNGVMFANLRSMNSTQVNFYSQHGRFARLDELNSLHGGALGVNVGNGIRKGKFWIEMSPTAPTDAELKNEYIILAAGPNGAPGDPPIIYRLNQSGEILQISP